MQRFKDIKASLDFLHQPEWTSLASNLSDFIDSLSFKYLTAEGFPKGIIIGVNMRLTYSLLKNRRWISSKDFQSILSEDLVDRFGIGLDFSRGLVQKTAEELRQVIDLEGSDLDDRYLEYLFVSIATASDSSSLVDNLGIGLKVIKRIKKAAESVFVEKSSKLHSKDTLEQKVRDIVKKYAKLMRTLPWAMDVARLEFILAPSAYQWSVLKQQSGLNILFNALMHVSEKQTVKGSEIVFAIEEQLAQYGVVEDSDCEKGLQILAESQLIYVEIPRKLAKSCEYSLSELGFEITSSAFAYENKIDFEKDPFRLLEVEEPYQCHIIKLMNRNSLLNLASILDKDYALSRGAISIFAERMVYIGEQPKLELISIDWMSHHPSYWIRSAAVDAISKLDISDRTRLSVKSVAESDASCAVQNKAIELLMREPKP